MSLDEEDTLDNWEQPNQSFSQRKEDEEVCVEDKSPEPDGPSKSKKGKAPIKVVAKDALFEEKKFSMLSKINSRMNERGKQQQNKGKVEKKEHDTEDVFCQALAFDLKQLPYYERCMAKHEMRNVLYKHQMSVMEQQMRPHSAYQNQNQSSMHPPVTPAGDNRMISLMQSSSTSSFASPPHTLMSQSQNSWLWELEKQQS